MSSVIQKVAMVATAIASVTSWTVLTGTDTAVASPIGTWSGDNTCLSGQYYSCSLQSLLNSMTTSGPQINTATPSTHQVFQGASNTSISNLLFEFTGGSTVQRLGIYSQANPSQKIELFGGSHTVGNQQLLSFLSNGDLQVGMQTYSGFSGGFGFYLDPSGTGQHFFYSENALNPQGTTQAVVYQGNNETMLQPQGSATSTLFSSDKFIVAFEGMHYNHTQSDNDFNDMVIMASGLRAANQVSVPAPSMAIGLLGVAGNALFLRKRRKTA